MNAFSIYKYMLLLTKILVRFQRLERQNAALERESSAMTFGDEIGGIAKNVANLREISAQRQKLHRNKGKIIPVCVLGGGKMNWTEN